MKILAIDTATEACSAALMIDGEVVTNYRLAPRQHSALILKMADDLLSEKKLKLNELDAIAFGCGPGSFMGLRIAAGVVQGMAFAHDLPVIAISSLKAIAFMAHQKTSQTHIVSAIDARMDEVYWGVYSLQQNEKNQQWVLLDKELVIAPELVVLPDELVKNKKKWVGAGSGWHSYGTRLQTRLNTQTNIKPECIMAQCYPSAEAMVQLAQFEFEQGNVLTAAQAQPIYLRNNVAKKSQTQKF